MRASIILLAMSLCACATEPSYRDSVMNRPVPTGEADVSKECAWIRSEIARMNSLAAASTMSQFALAFQAQARNNIAVLETRAAEVQCLASFAATKPETPKIIQCIDACKANTDRGSAACFDSCNK